MSERQIGRLPVLSHSNLSGLGRHVALLVSDKLSAVHNSNQTGMPSFFGTLVQTPARSSQKKVLFRKPISGIASGAFARADSYRSEGPELDCGAFLAAPAPSGCLLYLPSERSNDFCNFASGNAHEPQPALAETAITLRHNLNKANNVIQRVTRYDQAAVGTFPITTNVSVHK